MEQESYNQMNKLEAVNMQMVLEHYGLHDWVRIGHELHGRCPIHNGSNPRIFVISRRDNRFRCFAEFCKSEGNVFDFVAAIEKCRPSEALRKVGQWFDSGNRSRTHTSGLISLTWHESSADMSD
jgi:DNA primase